MDSATYWKSQPTALHVPRTCITKHMDTYQVEIDTSICKQDSESIKDIMAKSMQLEDSDNEEEVDVEELTDETCKWPIGHPNEEKFYFCGRKPEGDFPYCKLY